MGFWNSGYGFDNPNLPDQEKFSTMSILQSLLTPKDDYNYYIIFLSYLILSICCILLYVGSLFWEDIKGFWIVVSPYVLGLPYYFYMWKAQSSIKEKQD